MKRLQRVLLNGPFHYGWVIVANGFFLEMIVMGAALYAFSVFVLPLSRAFETGTFEVMLGLTSLNIAIAVLSPLAGHLIANGSPRRYMVVGLISLAIGFMLASLSASIWLIWFSYATFIGAGYALVAPIAASALITNWFDNLRGRALSIAAMGTSFGGLAIPPVVAMIVDVYGWRPAFQMLSGLFLVVSVPLVYVFVIDRPVDRGLEPYGKQISPKTEQLIDEKHDIVPTIAHILRQPVFWRLGFALGIGFAVFMAVTANIVPYSTTLGFSERQGALFLAGITACALVGKILFAVITDRLGVKRTFIVALLLNILAMVMLLWLPYFYTLFFAVICVGLSSGGLLVSWPGYIAVYFGKESLAKVMGTSAPIINGCMIFFPPFASKIYDITGKYNIAFLVFLFTLLLALFLASGLREHRIALSFNRHS
tara:strand:- start:3741 stop:5018 length:1278 start_codon:yes stop_codon:yes gene_type:complete